MTKQETQPNEPIVLNGSVCLCTWKIAKRGICVSLSSHFERYWAGVDPGIYVRGGSLHWRGVWGPPTSQAGPGQRRGGGPQKAP